MDFYNEIDSLSNMDTLSKCDLNSNDMVKNLYDIVDKTAEKFLFKKKKFAQNKLKIRKIPNNVRKLLHKKLKL